MADQDIFARQSNDDVFAPATQPAPAQAQDQDIFAGRAPTEAVSEGPPQRSFIGASAVAGGQQLLGLGAAGVQALAPTPSKDDLLTLYKDDPGGFEKQWHGPLYAPLRLAEEMQRKAGATMEALTPGGQQVAQREYFTLDPRKSALLSPERVAGDVLRSVPSVLATGAGVAAGLATRNPTIAAGVGGAAGGLLEGGSQTLEVRSELEKAPLGAWEHVPRFKDLLRQGWHPEMARRKVIEDTATAAGLQSGAAATVLEALGARLLTRVATGGGTAAGRIGRGAATEALTEAPQSAEQDITARQARQATVEPDIDIFAGASEAATQGAVVGGLVGGGATAVVEPFVPKSAGGGAEQPPPPPAGEPPSAEGGGSIDNNIGNMITADGKGFQAFATPEQGVAATIRNAAAYPGRYNNGAPMSLRQIAHKWAPPDDGVTPMLKGNNPDAWAQVVADSMGISPDEVVDLNDPAVAQAFARGVHRIEKGAGKLFEDEVYRQGAALALSGVPIASMPVDPVMSQARRMQGMSLTDEELDEDANRPVDDLLAEIGADEVRRAELPGDVPETVAAVTSAEEPTTAGLAQEGTRPPGQVARPAPAAVRGAPASAVSAEAAEQLQAIWQKVTRGEALGNTALERVLARILAKATASPLRQEHLPRLLAEVTAVEQYSLNEEERDAALRNVADSFRDDLLAAAPVDGRAAFGRSEEAQATLLGTPNPNNSIALGNLPVAFSASPAQVGMRVRQIALAPGDVVGVGVPTDHYPAQYFSDLVKTTKQLIDMFAPGARVLVTAQTRGLAATQSFMRRLTQADNFYVINPRNATRIDKVAERGLRYNTTTRAQIMYGLAHEVGHVVVEESFLEGLPPKVQAALRRVGQKDPFELVPEELIAQVPPDRAAILREFNEAKVRLLGPSSKATFGQYLTEVGSPQVVVQGAGQLNEVTAKQWAEMYFGQGVWQKPARDVVRLWHNDWPAGSLHEYLADQLARYAHNKGLLRNTALGRSQWFADLWATLQQFFRVLKDQGIVPKMAGGKAFERWVKGLAAKPSNRGEARARVPLPARLGEQRFEAALESPKGWGSVEGGWSSGGPEMRRANLAVRQYFERLLALGDLVMLRDALTDLAPAMPEDMQALAMHLAPRVGPWPVGEMRTVIERTDRLYAGTFSEEHFDRWRRAGGIFFRDQLENPTYAVAALNLEKSGGQLATNFLHEAVHAATAQAFNEGMALGDATAQALTAFHRTFQAQMASHNNFWVRYASTNPHELLATAFTEPAVREYLSSIRVGPLVMQRMTGQTTTGGTAWQAFVGWVRRVLQIPEGTRTALEAVLNAGRDLMERRTEINVDYRAAVDKIKQGIWSPPSTDANILPEADHPEASAAALQVRGIDNLSEDSRGEALEKLARGQIEAAKEEVEEGLAQAGLIRWASNGPQYVGLQQHIDQLAQAVPQNVWQSFRTWYASRLRVLAEFMDNFVNLREFAFADPSNNGAQFINMGLTLYKAFMGHLERRATERVIDPLSKLGAREQGRVFSLLQREWETGQHWTILARVPSQDPNQPGFTWEHQAGPRWAQEAAQAGLSQQAAAVALKVKNEYLYRLQVLHRNIRLDLDEKAQQALGQGRTASYAYYVKQMRDLAMSMRQVREVPFLPMTRFGQFILEVRDQQGDVVHVEAYEGPELRARARERLGRSPQLAGYTFREYHDDSTTGVLSVLPLEMLATTSNAFGLTPRQVNALRRRLDPVTRNPLTRKYSIRLGRISGHARNQLRTFADFMHADSLVQSKFLFRGHFREGLKMVVQDIAAANSAGDSERVHSLEHSLGYLRKAVQQILNPAHEYHLIRSMVVLKQLGFSIKTALANFTALVNLWAVASTRAGTLRGTGAVGRAAWDLGREGLLKAQSKVLRQPVQGASVLTPEERRVIDLGKQHGTLVETYAADMAAIASGNLLDRFNLPSTVAVQEWATKAWHKTVHLSMAMQRFVEETSRRTTLLAMFRIYRQQGMSFDEAYRAAQRDVELTQGDNTIQSRAPIMRGKKSLALIYFNYMRNIMWQMTGGLTRGRVAREQAGELPRSRGHVNETLRLWLAYGMLGGLMGLPGAEDLDKIVEQVAEKLFGKRVSLKEYAYALAQYVAENAGALGIDITPRSVVHGFLSDFYVPGIGRIDLSPSVSLGNPVPGLGGLQYAGEQGERFLFGLLGPAGRELENLYNLAFAQHLPPERRLALFIPTVASNILKGVEPEPRFFNGSRISVDPSTGAIRELSSGELLGQMMGFTPSVVGANREVQAMQAGMRDYWVDRRNHLLKAMFEARLGREPDAVHDVMARIRQYNSVAPRGMAITADSISASTRARLTRVAKQEAGVAPERAMTPEYRRLRELVVPRPQQ